MTAALFHFIVWPAFAIALVVFGFAPGALLRLIAIAFPSEDPRRRELLAELHAVPCVERPFWVMGQLEVALFEGVGPRLKHAITKLNQHEPKHLALGNSSVLCLYCGRPISAKYWVSYTTPNGVYSAHAHCHSCGHSMMKSLPGGMTTT